MRPAVLDMKMAPRNRKRVTAHLRIQMNSNPSYGSRLGQFYVKIELPYRVMLLTSFEPNTKLHFGSGRKRKVFTFKFPPSFHRLAFDGIFLQVSEAAIIRLPFEIVSDLPEETVGVHRQRVQSGLGGLIAQSS